MKRVLGIVMAVAVLTLTACGPSSKEDMLAKIRDVKTRGELENKD
jgi:hypothetical protein